MKKILYTLLLLSLTACSSEKSENRLIVGLQSDYPPFEFRSDQGDIVGFDVDVAKEIAKKLNREPDFQDMEFDGLILSLKQGKIDMILSGMNITPERQKEIHLVPYHGDFTGNLSLLFWGEVPANIKKLEDLNDSMTIAVESASFSDHYLEKYPGVKKRAFHNALEPLMDVKYGKATAALVEADLGDYLKAKYPEVKVVVISVPEEEKSFGFGIGIKKENEELIQDVENAVQELKLDGILPKLEEKWFGGK